MDFNKFNSIALTFLIFVLVGVFGYQTYLFKDAIKDTHTLRIVDANNKAIKVDSALTKEILKSEIKRIEDINDKRFEILSWFLAILFSVIAVFMTLQFVNSKTAIKDMVYEQVEEIIPDINTLIEERSQFIKSELNKLKNSPTSNTITEKNKDGG